MYVNCSYLVTFLKVYIKSRNFLVESLWSLRYKIISSPNEKLWLFLSYLYLFFLIVLAKIQVQYWVRVRKLGTWVAPGFSGNALGFSSFTILVAIHFPYETSVVLKSSLLFLLCVERLSRNVKFCGKTFCIY